MFVDMARTSCSRARSCRAWCARSAYILIDPIASRQEADRPQIGSSASRQEAHPPHHSRQRSCHSALLL